MVNHTDFTDREVIRHYHAHGESGQFHSGLKTDMDLERLPSGKFETNELVLELAILSYNILHMIGQESLGKRNPRMKRAVKRRRHRTVINNLINMTLSCDGTCPETDHRLREKQCLAQCLPACVLCLWIFCPLTWMTTEYLSLASL